MTKRHSKAVSQSAKHVQVWMLCLLSVLAHRLKISLTRFANWVDRRVWWGLRSELSNSPVILKATCWPNRKTLRSAFAFVWIECRFTYGFISGTPVIIDCRYPRHTDFLSSTCWKSSQSSHKHMGATHSAAIVLTRNYVCVAISMSQHQNSFREGLSCDCITESGQVDKAKCYYGYLIRYRLWRRYTSLTLTSS